ncbi:MAG: YHYH protein [Tepidisphaeraceae bacterium]
MKRSTALALSFATLSTVAHACPMHTANMGSYPAVNDAIFTTRAETIDGASVNVTTSTGSSTLSSNATAVGAATVGAWKINTTGAKGSSTNSTINALVSTVSSDVQSVYYDSNFVYVKHTDIPSHLLGPFTGNPAYPANANRTSRLPRTPVIATTKTTVGLGSVGVMVNGGLFFNPQDANSYNNQNVWHQNANVFEASSFDIGPGHPAPNQGATGNPIPGTYHYHEAPVALLNQIDPGNTGQHHSPIVGYAWDGFPIYGPYGYTDPNDASSAVKRITSGYQVRDGMLASGIRDKTSDTGTTLAANQRGPTVASVAAGSYIEDYEYVAGIGDLNEYNMRFTVTPEYPQGTWAYFLTLNAAGTSVYPYIIGPQYYGVVDTSNTGPTGGTTSIPGTATQLKLGDANIDGTVNFSDLLALAASYNATGSNHWSGGDFNRDGSVNFADLLLLAANYSSTSAASDDWAMAQLAVAPEPATVGTVVVAGAMSLRRRRTSH